VLTPKALAGKLWVVPETATVVLRDLRAAGLVREVTERGSFRAFAIFRDIRYGFWHRPGASTGRHRNDCPRILT